MILLGLAIGTIGTVNVMNALSERNPMPKALLRTMGYHIGEVNGAIKANQCNATTIQHHLARLESTAADIAPVFGTGVQDFTDHANPLQEHLQQAVRAAPSTCAALVAAIRPVGKSCKRCHDKYR